MSIETWEARLEKVEDGRIVTNAMVQSAMTDEIDELRAKLAAIAEREAKTAQWGPVGQVTADGFSMLYGHKPLPPGTKLYLPAGAPREPMTDAEIIAIANSCNSDACDQSQTATFVRAIESFHKIGAKE